MSLELFYSMVNFLALLGVILLFDISFNLRRLIKSIDSLGKKIDSQKK